MLLSQKDWLYCYIIHLLKLCLALKIWVKYLDCLYVAVIIFYSLALMAFSYLAVVQLYIAMFAATGANYLIDRLD